MYLRNIAGLALGLAATGVGFAQSSSSPASATPDQWRMPYQSGFWGHAGASIGQSHLRLGCPSVGNCDNDDRAFRVFFGGRFNNTFGAEFGLVNYGKFGRGGADTKGVGLDIPLMLGFPIGTNSSVFAKAGVHYSRMEVEGSPAVLGATGKETGWGPRLGLGAQIGLTPRWAIRGDWDRYRVRFPGTKDSVDTLTIGAQYSFR
jgi:OOP family OmpA-OmpF porin